MTHGLLVSRVGPRGVRVGTRRVRSIQLCWSPLMKNIILFAPLVLSACSTVTPTQSVPPAQTVSPAQTATPTQAATPAQSATPRKEQPVPDSGLARSGDGLSDLDGMTFGCPKTGLNAAAREAAKAPTQGHYQFSYFRIISDSHHSMYEVHFTSNYPGEPVLKYCVSTYCQQGWDSKTSKTTVSLIGDAPRHAKTRAANAAHLADCSDHQTSAKARSKR